MRKGDGGHGALGGDGRVHPCFGYQSDDDDDACVDERAKVRLRLWPRALLLLVGEYYVHDCGCEESQKEEFEDDEHEAEGED